MIKDIEQASKSFSFSNNLILTEKMNMFYFKVIVTPTCCNIISHNHKMITNVERTINDVWENAIKFVNKEIDSKREIITKKYGNVVIGFFYCPVQKPLSIEYEKFFNTNIENNKFIISNIKSIVTKEFIDISKFCVDIKLLNVRGIGGGPIILYPNEFIDVINSYIQKEITVSEVINFMNKNMKTFSGNSFKEIEGIVLNEKGKKYQLLINDVIDKKEYDRTEYEDIIKDFIITVKNDIFNLIKEKDYTSIINELFLFYIKNSSLLLKKEFHSIKLIPPGQVYIGDLNYNLINNDTIKTICRVNEVYKNIYRIIYKGLKQHKKYNSHLTILKEEDILNWNKIVDCVWDNKKG